MLRNLTYQTKALLLVLMVLALWWFLPGVIKRWVGPAFGEFQAPAWAGASLLQDVQSYWTLRSHSRKELIEGGIELSRLNAAYAVRNQQLDLLEQEVRNLESFFDLPSLPQYRYEVARVMRRDINAWWQMLHIRKGQSHGLRPGHAVIFAGGVVGRIHSVTAYTAQVELLSSPRFRAAAHFEGDTRPVEFRGSNQHGLRPAVGEVSTVPADISVSLERPMRLTSSRLGGVFPDGLTLGYVYRLNPTPDGLFQRGSVRLDPRLLELREVAVLVPVEAE